MSDAEKPQGRPVRLLLVDDHQIIRDSLEAVLSGRPGMQVVGQSDNGLDSVAKAAALRPDVMVLDIDLPGLGGMDVFERVQGVVDPPPAVVILSMFGDPGFAMQAMKRGVRGYVHKGSGLREIVAAVEAVVGGGTYVCSRTASALALVEGAPVGSVARLTPREREVLGCLSRGLSAKQTAAALDISPATVHVFRSRIRDKYGARSQAELVRLGIRLGLVGIEAGEQGR